MSPTIELLPISHRHRRFLHQLLNEPSVALFNDFSLPVTNHDIFDFIQYDIEANLTARGCRYVIHYLGEDVGTCGGQCDNNEFIVGFELLSEYRGKGIMTAALKRLIQIIKHDLDCHRVIAFCQQQNTPSITLLQNLGFVVDSESADNIQRMVKEIN